MAATARWWLRSAKASCSSREMLDSRAWFSATRPVLEIHVRVGLDEARIRRQLVAGHRHHAHRLGASGHGDLRMTEHDALGAIGDRLQTRRAEAIDGHRRCGDRDAGPQAGDTCNVQTLLAFRHRAAENHVLDVVRARRRWRVRDASRMTTEAMSSGRMTLRVPLGALPTAVLYRRNDDCVLHDYPSQSASSPSTASPTSEVRPSNK